MRLPKSLKRPKLKTVRLRAPFMVRRISGHSMIPVLPPGTIVIGYRWARRYKPGHVIVFLHESKEKIKRIAYIEKNEEFYVLGEHPVASTDSRHFGPIAATTVLSKIIWPRIHGRKNH